MGPEALQPKLSRTSLQMLLPNFGRTPNDFFFTSSPTPAAAELERLTEISMDLYNNRKLEELVTSGMLAPAAFKINQDGVVRNSDFKGHVVRHSPVLKENPDHQARIIDLATDVDDRKGIGTVFALLEVTGYPSTLRRQTISVVKWKRNPETKQWQVLNVSNMRGAQGFL